MGQGMPLLAVWFAIPLLIQGLGTDRFGVWTLAWMVMGYFSLFDLGLGRALTQAVGSVMKVTRRMVSSQQGHSSGSTSKMRRNNSAHRRRASSSGMGTGAAYTVCCPSVPARRLMPRVRDAYQP